MTKREKIKNVKALTLQQAHALLIEISIGCIHEGRKLLTSSEILDEICGALRVVKCDDETR